MHPIKIVVIGAGSASFGLNTLSKIMSSKKLKGSHLALVDRNDLTIEIVGRLARRLNNEWNTQMNISTHLHHLEALDDADFVVLSIEVSPREELWRSDFEIPLKYGVRQPFGENSGPGGFAHAARNIGPILEIINDMEEVCPDAWLINFSNPMTRICDAINRFSQIKVVGLCHQILAGYAMVGKTLSDYLDIDVPSGFTSCHPDLEINPHRHYVAVQALELIQIQAAGINHFTWMLSVTDKRTGEDLYPRFSEKWSDMDPSFEPLTRRVYNDFGIFPITGDSHLCEYLPWVSDPITKPWEKFDLKLYDWDGRAANRFKEHEKISILGNGKGSIDLLGDATSEGAIELIESIAGSNNHYRPAINLPNRGQISNVPFGSIVETPGMVSGWGIDAITVGELPESVAELCRRELTVVRLCVDAAVQGDYKTALQCLLLDPVITDIDVAEKILDDYLRTYRDFLPQFWN
jgi:alpha-galactosidase